MLKLPKLYPILDTACFSKDEDIYEFAREVIAGGATILQYRNKTGHARVMLEHAQELKRICGSSVRLIMNDRADLCLAADFSGCHIGQDDLSPEAIRNIVGKDLIVGVSTHNPEQLSIAEQSPADYLAIGPVFQTANKANPDPVVGLQGVRRARELTKKPLVAIGGITRANCHEVIAAGADSIAVIGNLVREPKKSVQEFLSLLS